jgi:hypothetical protein
LHQRVARLEAEVKARAPRMDLSDAVRLERASKVYRKLAAKYHPDHNPATADVMKDLNEFWQVLKGARAGGRGGEAPPSRRREKPRKNHKQSRLGSVPCHTPQVAARLRFIPGRRLRSVPHIASQGASTRNGRG